MFKLIGRAIFGEQQKVVGRTVLWSYHNKGILISFWLSHASKTSTYGYDKQGRITSLIDCNGHEVIVVSGETADSDEFHYQFIETAIKNINNLKEEGVPAENITWMVVEAGYKPKDLVNFAATADKLGINYVGISNKEQMIGVYESFSVNSYKEQVFYGKI